jgi:hypothetical protein
MFDKTGKRKPYCRCIWRCDRNRNKKSIGVNNFHKVHVIINNDHRYERNLSLCSSYLSCDYTAVTYKQETSYANTPASPIAEHHWPTCTWHRDSRDFSPWKLTKSQGLHENNRTVKNKGLGALHVSDMLSTLLPSFYISRWNQLYAFDIFYRQSALLTSFKHVIFWVWLLVTVLQYAILRWALKIMPLKANN